MPTFSTSQAHAPSRTYVGLPQLLHVLAERLDYTPSEKVVSQWRRQGCPHLPLGQRCIRYDPEAVISWLVERSDRGTRPKTHRHQPQRATPSTQDARATLLEIQARGNR